MNRTIIVVRELGRTKPDYSLPFNMAVIPRIGDYISIFRPDSTTHTEDLIVRRVWWQLDSPERYDDASMSEPRVGKLREVMVECDIAVGPYARDTWRTTAVSAEQRGIEIENFDVERFSVRERNLK